MAKTVKLNNALVSSIRIAAHAMSAADAGSANAKAVAVALVKKAGKSSEEYRTDFMLGYLAQRIAPKAKMEAALTKAGALLKLPNAKSDKPNRRTAAQEAMYSAARMAWARVLKEAGVTSHDKRGGDTSQTRAPRAAAKATKGAPAKATVAPIVNAPAPVAPKATTKKEVHEHLVKVAAELLAYINRNAKVTDIGDRNIIGELVASLQKNAVE